jgi:hypothetical protein
MSNLVHRSSLLDHWVRLGGCAGIAFVAFTVLGFVVQGDVPVYSDGPSHIREWFAENGDRYLAGYYLILIGVFFYFPFLASFCTLLSRAEGSEHPWARAAFFAGIMVIVAALGSVGFDGTLATLEGDVSDDMARAISAADYYTFTLVALPGAALTLAASIVILRTAVLWRPLAWVGLLITIGGLIGTAAPTERDPEGTLTVVYYASFFALLVWLACVSVAMLFVEDDPVFESLDLSQERLE